MDEKPISLRKLTRPSAGRRIRLPSARVTIKGKPAARRKPVFGLNLRGGAVLLQAEAAEEAAADAVLAAERGGHSVAGDDAQDLGGRFGASCR